MNFFLSKKIVFLLFFVSSILYSQNDNQDQLPEKSAELLLQMKYSGIITADMICYSYEGKVYVPLNELLANLRFYQEFDYQRKILKGYANSKDSTYNVDFTTGEAVIFGKKIRINLDSILKSPTEIYVVPSFFQNIFRFKVTPKMLKLTLEIESDYDLPIMQAYKRYKKYSFLDQNPTNKVEYAPLRFDKNFSFLDGGTMNYTLRFNRSNNLNTYGFSTNTGIMLFGGDFQVFSTGTFTQNQITKVNNTLISNLFRWRYNFGDNPYFTEISIGNLYSSGYRHTSVPSTVFNGIQFTNESTKKALTFSSIVYEDYIQPGWQVELYNNGFLTDHITTDATGHYKFTLPIGFGSSNIELRFYGPDGEVKTKKEIIQVPNEFLVPGEIKYTVNIGQKTFDKINFAEARLSVGITDFLSNTVSVTKLDSSKTFNDLKNSPDLFSTKNINIFNSLNFRLFSNLYFIYDYNQNNLQSLELNYWPVDWGSYRIKYTINDKNSFQYKYGGKSIIDAFLQLPQLFGSGSSIFMNYRRTENSSGYFNNLNATLFMNIFNFIINTNYNANFANTNQDFFKFDIKHYVSLNVSYNWFNKPRWLDFFDFIFFTSTATIDLNSKKINTISFGVNETFLKGITLQTTWEKNIIENSKPNISLTLRWNLPYFRSQSEVRYYQMKDLTITEEIQGILGYNSNINEVLLSNSLNYSNLGTGAVNIRFFLDDNSNGIYEEGEKIIPNVKVNIPNAQVSRNSTGDMIQVYNLIAYSQYNLQVDRTSIANPLWIPLFTEFSFIADPNVYKAIDIPCYAGGVIEGNVYVMNDSIKKGQAGVKVHVINADGSFSETLPVFSDGSFYKMGVPPGQYTAYVDSLQMAVLKVIPMEKNKDFTVQKTTTGDFVSDINFILKGTVPLVVTKNITPKATDTISTIETNIAGTINIDKGNIQEKPKIDSSAYKSDMTSLFLQYTNQRNTFLTVPMQRQLDKLYDYLVSHPRAKLFIEGHTDNFGTIEENMQVSVTRANEVYGYLVRKGISSSRLFASGKGALTPKADNITAAGRKANRRVELRIID